MITTITAKLLSKLSKYPTGEIELIVDTQDAEWILSQKYQLGQNGHPSIRATDTNGMERNQSLARLIMRRHGIPVDDDTYVCRKNLNPHDLTHDNLCVPTAIFQRHLPVAEGRAARTISLRDYMKVLSIHRSAVPVEDPCMIPVLDVDTAKLEYVIADAEDAEWMTGMPVRFSEKGFPMIQKDWGKWTPLMHEQARRAGASSLSEPVVFRLNPKEPRDVRKHYIAIVTKDRLMALA